MQRSRLLGRATSLRWQVKAIIPVLGALLLGLLAFEGTVVTLRVPKGHWILIIAASGAVMICLVVLTVLLVLVERPLTDLKRTINRVRGGDLSARVSFVKRDDDIGELGRQFNEMIEELDKTRREIERLHHSEMARAEHLATMGELAAGLAHEIRNPLAGIAGVVTVMGKELPSESSSRSVLTEVQDEIRRIQAILNDLLAYARPRPPEFHLADLNATVEQAVSLARQQTRAKPIHIVFTPDQDLPEVSHDPAQIQQLLLNLVLNGIQAIPERGEVRVATTGRQKQVMITVRDSGRGIAPEALPKIFKPFFTTRTEGTGLGLSLCKGIVDAHGGSIEVNSALGEGTQFTILLPLEQASNKAPA